MAEMILNNKVTTDSDRELDKLLKEFKKSSYYEDISVKNEIKRQLLSDRKILHALNIDGLSPDSPRDYYGKYILPYYIIPDTQTEPKNYICYETSFETLDRYNDILKIQRIIFYVLCCAKTSSVIDTYTDVARHDLIGSLIIDRFNYTNLFGMQIHLASDQARPVDNHFTARTLVFEQTTHNSITKNGVVINKLG